MLCMLFPSVDKIWSDPISRKNWNRTGGPNRFICDADAFPVYFKLAVPETSISRAELIALLGLDEGALTSSLINRSHENRPDGISRARATLEVLPGFVRDLQPVPSAVLVRSLMTAGDDLLRAERFKGNFFPPQPWLFSGALRATLKNVPAADRAAVLSTAIQRSGAIGAIAWIVEVMGHEHGKYETKGGVEREPLLTEAEVSQLEIEAISKIRAAAESGALTNVATLPNTLLNWQRWSGNDEVGAWILTIAENPRMLARLLEGLLSDVVSNGRVELRMDPEQLRRFVDPSTLIDAVRSLLDEPWLKENEKIAVEAFIQGSSRAHKPSKPTRARFPARRTSATSSHRKIAYCDEAAWA